MVRSQGQRRTSDWTCDEQLETAARLVAAVRSAAGPVASVRAGLSRPGLAALVQVLRSLPVVDAPFSAGPGGRELRDWFANGRGLFLGRAPVALLQLPETQAEYLRGRPRQALRTNVRRATELGIRCTQVTDPAELARVVAHIADRRGQDPATMVRPDLDPAVTRRFTVAHDAAGEPVALSETWLDGEWAGLATLVTVPGEGDGQLLRYLLHVTTVADLIDSGVRTVVVSGSMLLTSAGTRYFQRRTGFEPVWLRPVPGPAAPAQAPAAVPHPVAVPRPRRASDPVAGERETARV
jgi:hypothetical protein